MAGGNLDVTAFYSFFSDNAFHFGSGCIHGVEFIFLVK